MNDDLCVKKRLSAAPGRRERKAAETRERIFVAAISLFAERGVENVTVEQITEKADVGKGTFFNYFPNKEAVLTYFGGIQVERLQEAMERGEIGGSPREQVRQVMEILASYPHMTPDLARGMFVSALNFNRFHEVSGPNIWHLERTLAGIIAEGQQSGEFRATSGTDEAALFTLGLYFLALLTWCTGFTEKPLMQVVRCYADLALDGLAADGFRSGD
jgi:AcrR family transcriptional regulator